MGGTAAATALGGARRDRIATTTSMTSLQQQQLPPWESHGRGLATGGRDKTALTERYKAFGVLGPCRHMLYCLCASPVPCGILFICKSKKTSQALPRAMQRHGTSQTPSRGPLEGSASKLHT